MLADMQLVIRHWRRYPTVGSVSMGYEIAVTTVHAADQSVPLRLLVHSGTAARQQAYAISASSEISDGCALHVPPSLDADNGSVAERRAYSRYAIPGNHVPNRLSSDEEDLSIILELEPIRPPVDVLDTFGDRHDVGKPGSAPKKRLVWQRTTEPNSTVRRPFARGCSRWLRRR
jgi:hypothetical protein